MNLSDKAKEILDAQQGSVINSDEKRILVSAGPGSGKTYTLVRKIRRDLLDLEDWEGVVACSYTKEASKQLEKKLSKETDLKRSFIGTIDAFLLTEVFNPYKNRFACFLGGSKHINKFKVKFSKYQSLASKVTKLGHKCNKTDYNCSLKEWKANYCEGIYEISFVPYVLAIDLFEGVPEAKERFKDLYKAIYIDEAQDLNSFQIDFLKYLYKTLGLKCVLVGDKNQSIYAFRGAKPEELYQFINDGFKEYKITISVRCHPSILNFSDLFIGEKTNKVIDCENRVLLAFDFSKASFDALKGTFFILFEKNEYAKSCYDYLINNKLVEKPIIFSKSITLQDEEFKSYYLEIIEETLSFYFNFENPDRSLVRPLEEYRLFLSNFLDERDLKESVILDFKSSPCEYVLSILSLLGARYDDSVVANLQSELDDDCVKNHYRKVADCNRIMTIHSSKGLEADNVIVRIKEDPFRINDEFKRKMYVAFTRAKEKLFISIDKSCLNAKNYVLSVDSVRKRMMNK